MATPSETRVAACIAMSGSHGCIPDNCTWYRGADAYAEACESLISLFGLGRERAAVLKHDGYLELRKRDGAEYCEVVRDKVSLAEWEAYCQQEGIPKEV
jgi:hypothetical protein